MKRYRHVVRKLPRYWPPGRTYFLEGHEGKPLLTSGFKFQCPACVERPWTPCEACGGTAQLEFNDPRVRLVRSA